MKYLLITSLFLAGCTRCTEYYDTSVDDRQCWNQCVIAVAGSRYFDTNFSRCLDQACRYEHHEVCK